MCRSALGLLLVSVLLASLASVNIADATVGLRVSGGRLLESNGNELMMRGVAHGHAWYLGETSSFANIKSLGANATRVVLGSGHRKEWARSPAGDVANVITLCKQNRLICVLEVHDTTGFGDEEANESAASLDQAVNYWIDIQDVLTGQEDYVILNIGNEPYGNDNTPAWTSATINAIGRLRTAGFDHVIMVDAPNWGQDWQFVMRENAAAVFNSDPNRNTIFSIHMYGVFNSAAVVSEYMDAFQSAGQLLVVGEFGPLHSDGDPDEDAIMAEAQSRGLGYLGWMWSGNKPDLSYLDMANDFDPNRLTSWGQRIFNGANGIVQTGSEATIYSGSSTATVTPASPTPPTSPTPCPADCNEDSLVSIDELILAVNIALGNKPTGSCPPGDADGSGEVTVDELVGAVNSALHGCT